MPISIYAFRAVLVAALMAASVPPPARAASDWKDQGQAAVRLLGAPAETGEPPLVGIEIRLQPGWGTYWRDPGETGVAPSFDWSGSENLASARILWPAPERIRDAGMDSLGYSDRVVLPVGIERADPNAPARIRLAMDYAVCGTICAPKHVELVLEPGDFSARDRAAIAKFLDRVPGAAAPGLSAAQVRIAGDGVRLTLRSATPIPPDQRLDLIALGPDGAWSSKPEIRRAPDARMARFLLAPPDGRAIPNRLRLIVVAGERAFSVLAHREGGR